MTKFKKLYIAIRELKELDDQLPGELIDETPKRLIVNIIVNTQTPKSI